MKKNGRVCLVTGATSGIGEAFSRHYAQQGYDLVITGRREEKLRDNADSISTTYGAEVHVVVGDLSDASCRKALLELIAGRDDIEVLINNAGFGSGLSFPEGDIQVFSNMIAVHVSTPVELVSAVVPQMTRNKKGIIINVASIAAFTPVPGAAIYNGTKAFLVRFSESLYMKLRDRGIKVQALCPGFIRTDFHRRIGIEDEKRRNRGIITWMDVDAVMRSSAHCLERDKVICVPGFWYKVIYAFVRALPKPLYYRLISRRGEKKV